VLQRHQSIEQDDDGSLASPPVERAGAPAPMFEDNRFGAYRIRGVLGKGGMAKVYLAEEMLDGGRRRWRAIKIPEPDFRETALFRRMFRTEAALASRICHPHVCSVLEAGELSGIPFFTMELLRGRSLLAVRKVVRPTDVSFRHCLRIARLIADACEGLQAIHSYGANDAVPPQVVHRDISPDNLFLTADGFVKILDLGLAQTALLEDDGDKDLLRGKISYIAPELLNRRPASARSDVWGLGVVAWELLVGRPLFNEPSDYETLQAVREQAIVRPSELVVGLPKAIDPIVMRALQREPSARYASAAEFGRALWGFMVAEGEIVHHDELAKWLAELFPPETDVFTSLCSLESSDLMNAISFSRQHQNRTSGVVETAEGACGGLQGAPRAGALRKFVRIGFANLSAILSGLPRFVSLGRLRISCALMLERLRLLRIQSTADLAPRAPSRLSDLEIEK